MGERILQGRELNQTVADLRAHVQLKIDSLPRLAKNFSLGPEAVLELEAYLKNELTYLKGLPDGVKLRDVMESHFSRGAGIEEWLIGNE